MAKSDILNYVKESLHDVDNSHLNMNILGEIIHDTIIESEGLDNDEVYQDGYDEGYSAGVSSVDTDSFYQAGYEDGFSEGLGEGGSGSSNSGFNWVSLGDKDITRYPASGITEITVNDALLNSSTTFEYGTVIKMVATISDTFGIDDCTYSLHHDGLGDKECTLQYLGDTYTAIFQKPLEEPCENIEEWYFTYEGDEGSSEDDYVTITFKFYQLYYGSDPFTNTIIDNIPDDEED